MDRDSLLARKMCRARSRVPFEYPRFPFVVNLKRYDGRSTAVNCRCEFVVTMCRNPLRVLDNVRMSRVQIALFTGLTWQRHQPAGWHAHRRLKLRGYCLLVFALPLATRTIYSQTGHRCALRR